MKTYTVEELLKLKDGFPFKQWHIDDDGIFCESPEYFIAKERLWEANHGWNWEKHMAEKNWVDMREFVIAINIAREKFSKLKPKNYVKKSLYLALHNLLENVCFYDSKSVSDIKDVFPKDFEKQFNNDRARAIKIAKNAIQLYDEEERQIRADRHDGITNPNH